MGKGPLLDKVLLITGSTGIAAATAELAAEGGARLFITSRTPENAEALARKTGGAFLAGDLVDPATAAKAVEACVAKFGRLDAVYANANFLRDHRDAALELMAGLYKAIDFWQKNPAEGNKIIAAGLKFKVEDVELVLGKDGSARDGGLAPYTFLETARYCGVAPGDPPFGQKNGQIYASWRLINEWWVTFGLVKSMIAPTRGIDCSLLRELYETGLAGEPDPHY